MTSTTPGSRAASIGTPGVAADIAGRHQHDDLVHARKESHLRRLRRIEGQARGLQRKVEEEHYCIDILTQVAALTKALQAVALGLVDDHMARCVADADAASASGPEAAAKLKEASEAIARLLRA